MKSVVFTLYCSLEETLTFKEMGLTEEATQEEIDDAAAAHLDMLLDCVEIDADFKVSY